MKKAVLLISFVLFSFSGICESSVEHRGSCFQFEMTCLGNGIDPCFQTVLACAWEYSPFNDECVPNICGVCLTRAPDECYDE